MLALSIILLPALAAAQAADSVSGRGAPTFTIPRIEATVEVDGQLLEPAWTQATRLVGFHGFQPLDGQPADERTEVLVWYSPTAIHFGIRAFDRQPGTVRATLADRDRIAQEDRVTIYLDTFDDRRRAFLFAVNPLGVQQDGVHTESGATAGNPFGGSSDLSPDYRWDSRGRRTSFGYEVEVRIPFKSLRYAAGDAQQWGIQVTRHVQRTGQEHVWTDALRGSASFLGQSARVSGLHTLERGVVTEAQPFVTAIATGLRDPASGRFERESADWNAGANLRLGFANASLDATVNPDFSQVESDAGLVTANERFPLFVPEKRPFFLEGIELFATPNDLVYTRRMIDPVGGAKFTGKYGGWGVAYLSVLDDRPAPGEDRPLFNVLRLRRDVGTNSLAGVTIADRRGGESDNSVAAADARLVFGGVYYVEGQLGASRTESPGVQTQDGAIYKLEFDRTGRQWGFNYSASGTSEDFRAHTGFVPRTGVLTGQFFNRLTWYGERGALVERVTTFFGPRYLWSHGDIGDGPIEGAESISITTRLRAGWETELRVARTFADFDPVLYEGVLVAPAVEGGVPQPFVPSSGVRGLLDVQLELTTPVYRSFNASVEARTGAVPLFFEAAEGRERRVTASAALRPTRSLRADLALVGSWLTRARDGSEFSRTIIPRARLEYQPARALFFRMVGEYFAERRSELRDPASERPLLLSAGNDVGGMRLEWLASYEPVPGTVAYLGYATDLSERRTSNPRHWRAEADGLFLKLAYQFRR